MGRVKKYKEKDDYQQYQNKTKEIPHYVKTIWAFLKDCIKTHKPAQFQATFLVAQKTVSEDGQFSFDNKTKEIQFIPYTN